MQSVKLTTSEQVCLRSCLFWGLAVLKGNGDGSVQVYDELVNESPTTNELLPPLNDADTTIVLLPRPIICTRGLYVDTTATVYVFYE